MMRKFYLLLYIMKPRSEGCRHPDWRDYSRQWLKRHTVPSQGITVGGIWVHTEDITTFVNIDGQAFHVRQERGIPHRGNGTPHPA